MKLCNFLLAGLNDRHFASRKRRKFALASLSSVVHSNRCSNHFLGSSSWRKIIVITFVTFPIIFASHSILSFLYSVLKVLVGFPPLVGSNGLEPSTSRLSGVRSNHLSYEPISVAGSFPIGQTCCFGLVPATLFRDYQPRLSTNRIRELAAAPCRWWRRTESNCRPPACKAGALPAELRPRIRFVPG